MQTQQQQSPLLQGRVFARHRAFLRLPEREQRHAHALATFVDQSGVFRTHRSGFLHRHAVVGISCDALSDLVLGYLEKHPEVLQSFTDAATAAVAAGARDAAGAVGAVGAASASIESAATAAHSNDHRAGLAVVVPTQRKKQAAWTLVDHLVLSGFLRINGEEDDPVLSLKLDDFARPGVVFVPTSVAPSAGPGTRFVPVAGEAPVSAWSLRDDAVIAGDLCRAKTFGVSVRYYVLDGRRKVLHWFASDASTEPLGSLELSGVQVQSCGPHLVNAVSFCVKVKSGFKSLLLVGPPTADWINPMLACGAVFDAERISPHFSVTSMVVGDKASRRAGGGERQSAIPGGALDVSSALVGGGELLVSL